MDIREERGIFIRNRQLPLNVRCFIVDALARAFSLNHYGHTSSNEKFQNAKFKVIVAENLVFGE